MIETVIKPESRKVNGETITRLESRRKFASFSEKMDIISKMSNFYSPTIVPFLKDYILKLPFNDREEWLESLTYGVSIRHVNKNCEVSSKMILISHNVSTDLIIIDKKNNTSTRIDLKKICEISFGFARGQFTKLKEKKRVILNSLQDDLCITLHFQKASSFDLCFNSKNSLDGFLYGLFYMLKSESEEVEQLDRTTYNIKKLWALYDYDHSDKMEFGEFKKFIREMNIVEGLKVDSEEGLLALFKKIDKDHSGKIDYSEFFVFYKELSSGKEFEGIFKSYTKGSSEMKAPDLVKFMIEEQKESAFKIQDAVQVILNNKRELPKGLNSDEDLLTIFNKYDHNLFLNLEEFKNFISDKKYSNIYDLETLNVQQDMTRPLNEYFIYSSHNTYLTSHQLYGESNVEMYNFAVLNGCRLVELDCWDGEEEPIITHGRTFTTSISLRDVLKNLKENSFKTSPYPVLFSIEMHCKPSQQKIIAKLYKEILQDIYVIDENNPPDKFPSPEELKRMFIIKEGRNRIFRKGKKESDKLSTQFNNMELDKISEIKELGESVNSQNRKEIIEEIDEFDQEQFEDIPDEKDIKSRMDVYISSSIKNKSARRVSKENLENEIITTKTYTPDLIPRLLQEEKEMNFLDTVYETTKEITNEQENYHAIREDNHHLGYKLKKTLLSDIREVSNDYDMTSNYPNSVLRESEVTSVKKFNTKFSHSFNRAESYMKESKTLSSDNKKDLDREIYFGSNILHVQTKMTLEGESNRRTEKEEEKIVKELQELAGLIKIKLDWKKLDVPDYYHPWDCPAVKENKIEEMYKNFEMRKKIAVFCQNSFLKVYPSISRFDSSNIDPVKSWICGVQIAALNLQSLKDDQMLINNIFFKINKNCGLVTKPHFLRSGTEYNRKYDKPRVKVTLQVLSGSMLHYCNINTHKDIFSISMNCYIVGSWEDDNLNGKFQSKKYYKNLLNPIFEDEKYIFDVYEPELSFIILKLSSDSDVVARTCIPLSIMKEGIRVVPLYNELCQEISDSQLIAKVKIENLF